MKGLRWPPVFKSYLQGFGGSYLCQMASKSAVILFSMLREIAPQKLRVRSLTVAFGLGELAYKLVQNIGQSSHRSVSLRALQRCRIVRVEQRQWVDHGKQFLTNHGLRAGLEQNFHPAIN